MSLTTKGRYAARIMVCLARHRGLGLATKHSVGKQEGISPNYIEQIMVRLKDGGLVRSHRGRNGGFTLTRDPDTVTLAEVLRAVEGPVCPAPCLYDICERESSCAVRPAWQKTAEAVEEVLSGITIGRLAKEADSNGKLSGTYQI